MTSDNCYQECFDWLMMHPDKERFHLAHGIVTGQQHIKGIKYGHAWIIESEHEIALDITAEVVMPLEHYLKFGRCEYYVKYTWQEAVKMVNKFNHYGAWDEKVSAAVHKGDDGALISGSSPIC